MRASDIHEILRKLEIRPRKSFSQNFLIDPNISRKIVSTLTKGKKVLEIGPGLGALTTILLDEGYQVVAVEKDRKISMYLREKFPTLELYEDDFLRWDCALLKGEETQIISNLPYHITSPILEKILGHPELFSSATLMMQKEVAQRIIAKPRTKEYGALSVFLQSHAEILSSFTVSHQCFYPRPKVDSSVLHLKMKTPPPKRFSKMSRLAFQQRRKTLVNALKEKYDRENVHAALKEIGLAPSVRAEELTLDHFYSLFGRIS